jgi:CRP/FNR family transcriptional regulator, cyclic AMP receptor protein
MMYLDLLRIDFSRYHEQLLERHGTTAFEKTGANALSNQTKTAYCRLRLSLDKKANPQAAKMLAEVPLFSGLKGKQIKSVASAFARERSYDAGQVIEKEGESGVAFYLITDGSVEVRKGETRVAKLGRGQFFGEMALIDKQPRSATVISAESDTKCLVMPVWNFKAVVETDPKVAIGVMKELARRLRETTAALTE